MRFGPPTASELRSAFASVIDGIHAGKYRGCPTGLGFDNQTFDAISAFAASSTLDPKLEAAAQTALMGQITGMNSAEDQAALAKALDTPGA